MKLPGVRFTLHCRLTLYSRLPFFLKNLQIFVLQNGTDSLHTHVISPCSNQRLIIDCTHSFSSNKHAKKPEPPHFTGITNLRELSKSASLAFRLTTNVISWGAFVLKVNRADGTQKSPSSATLVNGIQKSSKAKNDVVAGEAFIVFQQPKEQPAWWFQQTHRQAYRGKVRGIYRPPLVLQSDRWVSLISAPFLPPLSNTRVYIQSQSANGGVLMG